MLVFLWLTFLVLTIVAFFAILFTGRYPRGIFDFNVGVLRWTWRVGFYSYAALGTDRYPPFTLDDVPDYPARLDVAYPERLSRGLVLVKSWLLAIPHYIVVGILLGGGSYAASRAYDRAWGFGYETGLIGVLVFFAGVALLFTTRYPRGIFDVVLGLDRWVARVAAYVFLMRDEYPPFRLDQGGAGIARPPIEAVPAGEVSRARSCGRGPSAGTVGRVVLIVVGVVVGIVAFGLLAGGCALVAVDQTQRDDDGYLMSPSAEFSTRDVFDRLRSCGHRRQRRRAGPRHLPRDGTTSQRERPQRVRRYRPGSRGRPLPGRRRAGRRHRLRPPRPHVLATARAARPAAPPGAQTFWVASATGSGEQTLKWKPEDGNWRAVVMNDRRAAAACLPR